MIVNIDADLVAYRCAASVAEDAACEFALARVDRLMQDIVHSTQATEYRGFLTGSNNFRKKINPQYKANRKDQPLPKWLQECREFLVTEWNCQISDECEADDLLGIAHGEGTICASLDKDLKMIPGLHYNWVKEEMDEVTPIDGLRHMYKQMLIGDKADNIFGVAGIGPVKAERHLGGCETEQEMVEVVWSLYNDDAKRFIMNAQCLWIMQEEGVTWAHRIDRSILPDPLQQELEVTLGSTIFSTDVILTGPTTIPTMTCGIPVNGESTESIAAETVPLTWSTLNE